MNVKQLKALIGKLPDTTLVVVSTFDHCYRVVNATKETACWNAAESDLTECFWNNQKDINEALGTGYIRIPILLVE